MVYRFADEYNAVGDVLQNAGTDVLPVLASPYSSPKPMQPCRLSLLGCARCGWSQGLGWMLPLLSTKILLFCIAVISVCGNPCTVCILLAALELPPALVAFGFTFLSRLRHTAMDQGSFWISNFSNHSTQSSSVLSPCDLVSRMPHLSGYLPRVESRGEVACMENTMQFTKLTHESIFGNCRCSPAVLLQPPTFTRLQVWYRGATYATLRMRIGSGMIKLCHT
jgi:hypothetical protein